MTGASPLVPDLESVRMLLSGARALGGPYGAVLELCILTICLPGEAVAIDLAEIDWAHGRVVVPARGWPPRRLLHLPSEAVRTIVRVASDGRCGQAVTAGQGRPLDRRDVRLDRLKDRLAAAAPGTITLAPWNFQGLRMAAANALEEHGCSAHDIGLLLGLKNTAGVPASRPTSGDDSAHVAIAVEKWNAILADRRMMNPPARERAGGCPDESDSDAKALAGWCRAVKAGAGGKRPRTTANVAIDERRT